MRALTLCSFLLVAAAAQAAEPVKSGTPIPPGGPVVPSAMGACAPLPKPRAGPLPFASGEKLVFDVDIMGARAGKMTVEVLPTSGGDVTVRARADSNTFFNKVRRIRGEVVSTMRQKDLRPRRFREDLSEGDIHRKVEVIYPNANDEKYVQIDWKGNRGSGKSRNGFTGDAIDYLGGMFLFRAVPLKVGEPFCFDAYAMRRMWRVEGKVEAREHVSTPAGEFDAFHLSALATRIGGKPLAREVHIWVSDDAYRLPLAGVGVIDLGPVRATLASVTRHDLKRNSAKSSTLEW